MDNYDFETYLEIDSEIKKLKNFANTFGKKVYTDSIRLHQLSVYIDLDKYFRATIYFNFSLRGKFLLLVNLWDRCAMRGRLRFRLF